MDKAQERRSLESDFQYNAKMDEELMVLSCTKLLVDCRTLQQHIPHLHFPYVCFQG